MNKQHKKPRCDDMYRAILTLKTVDDIDRYLHLPVLAAVPYYREMDRK